MVGRLAPGNSVKRLVVGLAVASLVGLGVAACRALEPPTTPEGACIRRCEYALKKCSKVECERGCGLALDKLVEGEGERVFACLADAAKTRCDDRVWAVCAVRTGATAPARVGRRARAHEEAREEERRRPPMSLLKINDDRHREHLFGAAPKRVVSLVPSDTYSIAALGCGDAIVGRTDYCELPVDLAARVPAVGGTKNPRLEAILDLEPDLVIANQEENTRSDLEALTAKGVRVYVAFPQRVADGLAHLARLARIFRVGSDASAKDLIKRGYEGLRAAEAAAAGRRAVPTFCPIWMNPLMTIHGSTFISDALALAGAANVFADRTRKYPLAADLGQAVALTGEKVADRDVRYPRVTREEVEARAPELVLLPDEPHPFTDEDVAVFRGMQIPAAPRAIVRFPGKDVCWYGAWSVDGLPRLRALVDGFRPTT
jgi:ABC-type Fe3+-hydroxamate transport system substrate-binding protein